MGSHRGPPRAQGQQTGSQGPKSGHRSIMEQIGLAPDLPFHNSRVICQPVRNRVRSDSLDWG